jgi:uncharacterized repeat protein (TIGR03803 family)
MKCYPANSAIPCKHSLRNRLSRLAFGALAAVLTFILLHTTPAYAQYFKTLQNLRGTWYPLAQGRDGNLYGIGGMDEALSFIYRLTPAGKVDVLYNFDTNVIQAPRSALTLGSDGDLYGTTGQGIDGYGTYFKITPSGELTILHSFGFGEPIWPYGALLRGRDDNFYGMAAVASPVSYIVFRATPSGTVTTVCAFDPSNSPISLIQGRDGNFYGTASQWNQNGIVFKLTPAGSMKVLYNFDGVHGSKPGALVQGPSLNYFGAAFSGGTTDGGVLFRITPSGALAVLHNFDRNSPSDGYGPSSFILASDGNFYGTTMYGGMLGYGVIFRMSRTGNYLVLHHFNKVNGSQPSTLMQHTSGKMYGTTQAGGTYKEGVAFQFDWALKSFVTLESTSGVVGSSVGILGNGLSGTLAVQFNGVPASFSVEQDGYLTATVPDGASTGYVQVTTQGGTSVSRDIFSVIAP